MGMLANMKECWNKTLAMVNSFKGLGPITERSCNDPKYKRTTTSSRRAEQQRLDCSRYLHVSCPPNHNLLNKSLGITKGVTYRI